MSKNNLFDEWNIDNKKNSNQFSKSKSKTGLSTPKKEIKTGVEKYNKIIFFSFFSVIVLVSFTFLWAIYPKNSEISQSENMENSNKEIVQNGNSNSTQNDNSNLSSNNQVSEQNKTESKESIIVNQEDINRIKENETVKPKTEEEIQAEKEEKNRQLEELKTQEGINDEQQAVIVPSFN